MFDFFYGDSEQYMFYRVPQILFTDDHFKALSCEAKLLYGFLLDRTSLSKKNGWIDKGGLTFVYYKQELVQEQLNIGRDKAMRIFNELEKIGLIIRKKQGLGKPTKIFVMNFAKPIDDSGSDNEVINKINALTKSTKSQKKSQKSVRNDEMKSQRSKKSTSEEIESTSGCRKNRPLEVDKNDVKTSENSTHNHTEINHTEINHTNLSINQADAISHSTSVNEIEVKKTDRKMEEYEECINKAEIQISYYELLSQGYNHYYLDLIVNLTLMAQDIGTLIVTLIISFVMIIVTFILLASIIVVLAARIIEVFMQLSIAPIPMATFMNKEWSDIGKNWLRNILALAFQGFFIIVALAIFQSLFNNALVTMLTGTSADVIMTMATLLGFIVAFIFTMFRTSSISKSAFSAH